MKKTTRMSSHVSVKRAIGVLNTFYVLAGDEIVDTLLDQGNVWLETASEHGDDLGDEDVVREFLAGPGDG